MCYLTRQEGKISKRVICPGKDKCLQIFIAMATKVKNMIKPKIKSE